MTLTLEQICSLTGGTVIQRGSCTEFSNMASLDEATTSDVSFLGNEKYFQDYLKTQAGLVLIPEAVPEYPAEVTLVQVANPSQAFGEVVKFFVREKQSFQPGVHPSASIADDVHLDASLVSVKANAVVETGAVIGNGTEIGPGVVVGERVQIGNDCVLYSNSSVREDCVLGDRVILQPNCVIGSDGYGYELIDGKHEKVDQVGNVVLGNDVEVGSNTTIDRARFGKTVIGEGTKIDNLVQIAHNVQIGKHCLIVAQVGISGSTKVGDYVTFAGQSGTVGHISIADKVILTARTVAMKNITEPGGTYMGVPARPMRQEMKKMALVARLPKLMADVEALRDKSE